MMAKIWLTYAWADNADLDVGVVVSAIEAQGVEVLLDRRQIRAGHDLWAEIEAGVQACDGWVLMVTAATLSSRPCLKELDLATAAASRSLGHAFPMIGLFPQPIDKSLVPGSLVGKLWLTLSSPDWAERLSGAASATAPTMVAGGLGVGMKQHAGTWGVIVELWPRVGRWSPFGFALPPAERRLVSDILTGPRDRPPSGPMVFSDNARRFEWEDGWAGMSITGPVTPDISAFVLLEAMPTQMRVGELGSPDFFTWTSRSPKRP